MRKLNLKNIVLAGLVGLFFSASAYAQVPNPLSSNLTFNFTSGPDECEFTAPGSQTGVSSCQNSGSAQAYRSALLENMNTQFAGVQCSVLSPVPFGNYPHNLVSTVSNAFTRDYIDPASQNIMNSFLLEGLFCGISKLENITIPEVIATKNTPEHLIFRSYVGRVMLAHLVSSLPMCKLDNINHWYQYVNANAVELEPVFTWGDNLITWNTANFNIIISNLIAGSQSDSCCNDSAGLLSADAHAALCP